MPQELHPVSFNAYPILISLNLNARRHSGDKRPAEERYVQTVREELGNVGKDTSREPYAKLIPGEMSENRDWNHSLRELGSCNI